jgi:hypothetical protein
LYFGKKGFHDAVGASASATKYANKRGDFVKIILLLGCFSGNIEAL